MYFIHILFGILHVAMWIALVMLWLSIGVFANRPLLAPLYESCKEDVSCRKQDDDDAIRRAMVSWYFLSCIIWPLMAVWGLAYIMTGGAPQVKDKQAAAAAKKLEDDVKRIEDVIREWNPTDKFADAAAYAQDLVEDGVSAVRNGDIKDFADSVLDEGKVYIQDTVKKMREDFDNLVSEFKTSAGAARGGSRNDEVDDFGFSDPS